MFKYNKKNYNSSKHFKCKPVTYGTHCNKQCKSNAVYGIHEKYGSFHAEINAIKNAGEDVSGCELFVTLEPCSTYGKTPPCVEKIISSGIKKVYIGVLDVNPKHRGRGVNILRNAGIEVEYGVLVKECSLLIEDFIKYQTLKLPYVTLKTASSIDGKIACKTGHSKWITGDDARELVHKMRGLSDVVLTGIGTVEADNPLMTDRRKNAVRQPVRAVLDSSLKIDINANIVNSAEYAPVIIYTSENADSSKIMQLNDKNVKVIKVPCVNGMLDIKEVLYSLSKPSVTLLHSTFSFKLLSPFIKALTFPSSSIIPVNILFYIIIFSKFNSLHCIIIYSCRY